MMKKVGMFLLLVICLLVFSTKNVMTDEKPSAEKITRLIKELGDDDWKTRENAQKALGEIGEPALEPLRNALKDSQDPEIRMRARHIIAEIEGMLAVNDLVKNWSSPEGKELWYRLKGERNMEGFIRSLTKEDKYKGEDVIKMKDTITMTEGGSRLRTFTMTSFCRKDKNLTPLYAKIEIKVEGDTMSMEYKFEKGKMALVIKEGGREKKSEAVTIPQDAFLFNSFVRYITTLPFKKGFSISPTILGIEPHDLMMKFNISCEGKDEVALGKDKITAYKFKLVPEHSPDEPGFVWVSEKRQFVKFCVAEEDMELVLVSKEEAEKGLAELKKKVQEEQEEPPEEE